ncbi:MAG TPA: YfhO family protein [Thermoanaerobaculia bacterium]|nr:YfhO family protein [Thermoanaerobaculia bacterium]
MSSLLAPACALSSRPDIMAAANSKRRNDLRREAGRAVLALAALLAIAYANVVFLGRSLVYSNSRNPVDERPSAASYGPDFDPAERWTRGGRLPYANFHDPGGAWWQWEPGAVFLREGLLGGELPFWDPYVGAGTPAMANAVPALLYPPYLLMVLAGNTVLLRNLYALGTLLAAGLFTWLLLRGHGLGFRAALVGAAAFVFSGALTQNVGSFLGQTTATLPAALWLTQRFFARPSAGRAAALATGYAAISLASFPPILIAVFGLTAAYAAMLARAPAPAAAKPGGTRRFLTWAGAAALALALVGFYYLPMAALVRASPHVSEGYEDGGLERLPPVCLLQLASPTLAGGGKIYFAPAVPDPAKYQLPYLGLVPLLLAGLAGWRRGPARRLALFAGAASALLVAKILGLEPIQSVGRLPIFESVHFAAYLGMPLGLLLALLAALGWERLERGEISSRRARIIAAAGLLLVAGLLAYGLAVGAAQHESDGRWWGEWARVGLLGAVAAWLLVAVARSCATRADASRRARLLFGLFTLLAVEAVVNTRHPRPPRFDVWRHPPPYVEALQREAGLGRVLGAAAFDANAGSAFEVMSLDSLATFNSQRLTRWYRTFANPNAGFFLREASQLPPEAALDAANVEILALRKERTALVAEAEARGYEVFYRDGFATLFRRQGNPRYYFTSEYLRTNGLEALRAQRRGAADRQVQLEQQPGFEATPNSTADPKVEVVAFRRNGYRLRLEAPRPGLVYASETAMAGWTAKVNGRPATILNANFAFRAVEVPAGKVEIEMTYWPPGLTAGLSLSGLGLLVVGWLCAVGWRKET